MPNYDWQAFQALELRRRFADSANGFRAWTDLVDEIERLAGRGDPPEAYRRAFDDFMKAVEPLRTQRRECRVFISHRSPKPDVDYARRVAWLANRQGCGYWLDVEDPALHRANGSLLGSPARDVLIAAIIEMGLLNASHVLAVITANSAGSKWIPY